MGFDAQDDVKVAWRAAAQPGLAFAADPNLRPGVDPGGDLHREALRFLDPALPAALGARAFQDASPPAACRAGRGGHDLAEEGLGGAPDLAGAPTSGARLLSGAGLGPAARAAVAGRQAWHVDLLLDARERFVERDRHVVPEVVAAVGSLAARPRPEAAAEEIGRASCRERGEMTGVA